MPVIRGFGWLVYGASCAVFVVLFSVPLAVFAVLAGVGGGVLIALVLAGVVLFGAGRTEIRTPADVAAGKLPGRVPDRYVRRDAAWPQYFAAQVLLDARSIRYHARVAVDPLWQVPPAWVRAQSLTVWWPLYVPVVAFQFGCTIGLAAATAGTLAVVAVTAGAAWAVGVPAGYLLRGLDAGWRRAVRARVSCPSCYEVAAIPAYRCLGPHPGADRRSGADLHRDIRPGRLGVVWRRCACHRQLPTTVLRAAFSSRLQACCPSCGEPLRRGAGAVTDILVPVIGAASAGKTQLVMSSLVTLHRVAGGRNVRVHLTDDHSRAVYRTYESLARNGLSAPKTSVSTPVAVTAELVANPVRRALMHVFDAAGELVVDREENARLSYVDYARSLIFVLDPFSIPYVRDQFETSFPDVFEEANPVLHDPEESYRVPVSRLREYGVRTRRQNLAFVVSKADLLAKISAGPTDDSSAAVARWLSDNGLANLVVATGRDFGRVRFFLTAGRSLDEHEAFAPLAWILEREWIRLVR